MLKFSIKNTEKKEPQSIPTELELEFCGEYVHLKANGWYLITLNPDGTITRAHSAESSGFQTNMRGEVVITNP